MKKSSLTLTAALIALGAVTAQAQFTYVDAIDFSNHPNSPTLDPSGGAGAPFWQENTFVAGGGPFVTDLGNGTSNWRYRNTGPAGPLFGTSGYAARRGENDPPVFTTIGGLTSGNTYTIKLYGGWTTANNTWGLSYSLAGGTWSSTVDRDTIITAAGLGFNQGWVDAADTWIAPSEASGDSRGNIIIGTAVADINGEIQVGVQGWPNTSGERGVYDGVAWAPGVVPEPTTFALAGLGAAALLIFRRRQ